MIDEKRTLELFGVDVNTLTKCSGVGVWAVCKKCGVGRELSFMNAKKDKLCMSCSTKSRRYIGKDSPNWKGGKASWRTRLAATSTYKNWRNEVFKRDNYTCMVCGSHINLEAHHIEPVREHKNDLLVYDVDNGITLCEDCHRDVGRQEYYYADTFRSLLD